MLAWLKSLSSAQKRVIFIALDSLLIVAALYLTFHLQMPSTVAHWSFATYAEVLPHLLLGAAGLSYAFGVSSIHLNQFDAGAIVQTGLFAAAVSLLGAVLSQFLRLELWADVHIIFGITLFMLLVTSRTALLHLVLSIYRSGTDNCRVLIYGAGTTGLQLVSAFRSHELIEPVAFVDDNKALHGISVGRLPVYSPVRIAEIVAEKNIDRVLLAMPSLSPPKQAQIARRLQKMGLDVQTLPSFSQLIGEEALVDKLQPVNASRYLNRAEVSGQLGTGSAEYAGRVVLISGAGGSIGSELCRQVIECRPAQLVLYELSELALYNIHQELMPLAEDAGVDVVPVLGSVTDARQVRKVLADHSVKIVIHAAAYKHVPIVEANPLAGLANNVLGTQTLAEEASRHDVDRFILISSDKAVRPTNVMGASKRLAELVVQDLASRVPRGAAPIYSIVRFGNVLGSSGSVVPLFQEQLRRGGPLTVTHPDVQRYFMTVQEAVNLVLQAGAMAEGGEVYVLDMGKPVPIVQLARQVIENAGYTLRNASNPDGDIEIEFTGLRPGEKMSEELTITGSLVGTRHRKIFYTTEEKLSEIEVASALRALRQSLATGDEDAARAVAMRWVEGYNRRDAHALPANVDVWAGPAV